MTPAYLDPRTGALEAAAGERSPRALLEAFESWLELEPASSADPPLFIWAIGKDGDSPPIRDARRRYSIAPAGASTATACGGATACP